jgi:hypothetical protein
MGAQVSIELTYRDAFGTLARGTVEYGPGLEVSPAGLRRRQVLTASGRYTQTYIPQAEVSAVSLRSLENEIRATTRLRQLFRAGRYPENLPCVIGFDLTAVEPFALFTGYTGEPLTKHLGGLDEAELGRVWSGLLTALVHTTTAGIVHGGIDARTVWWDGSAAQLVAFENATVTDRYCSGPADGDRDVHAAGALLAQAADPARTLPRRMRKVVSNTSRPPGKRPTVAALAQRAGLPAEPVAYPLEAHLQPGYERFDSIATSKSGRPSSGRSRFGAVMLTLVGVLAVAVVVLTVAVLLGVFS